LGRFYKTIDNKTIGWPWGWGICGTYRNTTVQILWGRYAPRREVRGLPERRGLREDKGILAHCGTQRYRFYKILVFHIHPLS